MGITVTKWRLLPVINVLALGQDTANRLARALDRYADKQKEDPGQFNPDNPDLVRLGIDTDFLSAINPSINLDEARKSLLKLYGHVYEALRAWIVANNPYSINACRHSMRCCFTPCILTPPPP